MGPPSLASDAIRQTAARATRLEAVVFDGHAGAIHRPVGQAARGVAVVICPPLGRDARCAYRPLFLFAEALAAAGFPVLRYDHLGGGDSLPLEAESDHWPLWVNGVERAAAFARAHGGALRLVLAGLRIGASLAATAAANVKPDGLMLLAPVASGRGWVRELQSAAATAGRPPPGDGSIEVDGLRLSQATLASLKDVDLRRLAPSGAQVFLATPSADPRLAAGLGPRVSAIRFPGYAELFREAHLNSPPGAVFEAAGAWLEGLAAGTADAGRTPPPVAPVLAVDGCIERPVAFGKGLRGVLCLPAKSSGGQGVIIGNAGADPRAGVGGFAVRACRTLAARGIAALRLDFAGLGESAGPDDWRSHVFETSRTADFRAAADLLAEEGYGEPVLVGVCTGGYQALRAALDDARFRRIVTINPWFTWRPGASLQSRPLGASLRRAALAGADAPDRRRAAPGEPGARRGLKALMQRLRRRFRLRPSDRAGRNARAEIARIAATGGRIRVLMGRDDVALEDLEEAFGPQGRWLARRRGVELSLLRDFDHGLASRCAQDLALGEILRFLASGGEVRAGGRAVGEAGGADAFPNRQAAV